MKKIVIQNCILIAAIFFISCKNNQNEIIEMNDLKLIYQYVIDISGEETGNMLVRKNMYHIIMENPGNINVTKLYVNGFKKQFQNPMDYSLCIITSSKIDSISLNKVDKYILGSLDFEDVSSKLLSEAKDNINLMQVKDSIIQQYFSAEYEKEMLDWNNKSPSYDELDTTGTIYENETFMQYYFNSKEDLRNVFLVVVAKNIEESGYVIDRKQVDLK
ncbi:MAG: hypothetical protein JEY96_00755 [Bacteroidales bacterium]|nr:hypothetical protein [Bacteroidales bacterium]